MLNASKHRIVVATTPPPAPARTANTAKWTGENANGFGPEPDWMLGVAPAKTNKIIPIIKFEVCSSLCAINKLNIRMCACVRKYIHFCQLIYLEWVMVWADVLLHISLPNRPLLPAWCDDDDGNRRRCKGLNLQLESSPPPPHLHGRIASRIYVHTFAYTSCIVCSAYGYMERAHHSISNVAVARASERL